MSSKQTFPALLILLLTGLATIIGAVVGGIVVYQAVAGFQQGGANNGGPIMPLTGPTPASSPAAQDQLEVNTTNVETTITQAVQKVASAVVTVVGSVPGQASAAGQPGFAAISGSGVFISNEGYILTNNHVIEGMREVTIVLSDGAEIKAAVVGADPYADLAVLKTEEQPPAFAPLGNSDVLTPGETVIAIGSPLGDFKNTVTVGVISATGRSIDTGAGFQIEGLLQTDAAINQGNSGGPLLNLAGEVIGINTLVVRAVGNSAAAEGLGFAIPSNAARAVADQIIQQGFFTRPYLGIRWQTITPDMSAVYNLPNQWGVYVTGVVPGSPAQSAGIQQGDIITHIGGTEINQEHSYINALFKFKPGDQVELEILREGNTMKLQVTLGESAPD